MSHQASETRPGSFSRGTRSATIASANPATSPFSAEMAADNVGAQDLGASALPPATSSTSNSSASSAPSTVSDRSAQNQRLNRPSVLPHSVSSPLRSTPSTPGAVPAAAAANQRIPPSLQAKLAAVRSPFMLMIALTVRTVSDLFRDLVGKSWCCNPSESIKQRKACRSSFR